MEHTILQPCCCCLHSTPLLLLSTNTITTITHTHTPCLRTCSSSLRWHTVYSVLTVSAKIAILPPSVYLVHSFWYLSSPSQSMSLTWAPAVHSFISSFCRAGGYRWDGGTALVSANWLHVYAQCTVANSIVYTHFDTSVIPGLLHVYM